MTRRLLPESQIHEPIRGKIAALNRDVVDEVIEALENHDLVVVCMGQNPHCRRARATLKGRDLPFRYLEYGSYLSQWRRRAALKMWTGWPTFPMVFVKSTFVGGADCLERLVDSGEIDAMLEDSEG